MPLLRPGALSSAAILSPRPPHRRGPHHGTHSKTGQLLDLSSFVGSSEADAFQPSFWQAIQFQGKPYGVPQQTDVSALVFQRYFVRGVACTGIR